MTEKFGSYRQFQKSFSQIIFLIHFSNEKTFYIDINAFKRRGFGTMIYHLKSTSLKPEKPKRSNIEPFFFQPNVQ